MMELLSVIALIVSVAVFISCYKEYQLSKKRLKTLVEEFPELKGRFKINND